jgi:predicted nucleic acid-binding protein
VTSPSILVLDACACINFAAALPLQNLEENLGRPVRMVDEAATESLFLYQWIDGQRVKVAIDVQAISTLALADGPELELYVHLAQRLGDGEAASLAVSHCRGLEFVTDDRAARRLAASEAPKAQILGTAQVMRSLTTSMALTGEELAHALRRVESQASFRPAHDDPELEWWRTSRGSPD